MISGGGGLSAADHLCGVSPVLSREGEADLSLMLVDMKM